MIHSVAYIGNIISVFFIFIILARTLFPYFGISYGKFYGFVYQYSEYIMKPIRNKLSLNSRFDYSPIIAILGFYLLKDIFFASIYGKISGLEFLFFGEIKIFAVLSLIVILRLISSILTFYLVVLVFSIILKKTLKMGSNNYQYILSSITNPIIAKIRMKLPFNMKKYDYLFAIILVIICKFILIEIIELLLKIIQ